MSRLSTIEAGGFALVQAIPTLNDAKLTALGLMGTTRPESFPGAVCCLGDPIVEKPSINTSFGHTSTRLRVPFHVLCYANSDGQQLGDARGSVWKVADDVIDKFTNPAWNPTFTDGTTVYPAALESPFSDVLPDTSQAVVGLTFTVVIEWRT